MAGAPVTFNCPQCGRKFSAPTAIAGKTISCGCGSQVVVPTLNSAVTPQQPTQTNAGQTSPVGRVIAQPPTKTGTHREFPSLKKLARVLEFLSYLLILFGILTALLLLGMGVLNGPAGMGVAVAALLALAVVILLTFITTQASAELIRLSIYIVELLEDIRAK